MYGFIHCALADMIQRKYDEDKWKEILILKECQYIESVYETVMFPLLKKHALTRVAGIELEGGSFLIHSMYPDEDMDALLCACCEVLAESREEFLEAFGCHFMIYCFDSGYDGILRALGGTLFDFLRNLDALHDHLASTYPGMSAPVFKCELQNECHILLHYHSHRADLYPIVIGLVKSVAKELYKTEVQVSVISQEMCNDKSHVTILVADSRQHRVRQRINSFSGKLDCITASFNPKDSRFSSDFFCKAFPFHIMFNRNLEFIQVGNALKRHLKKRNCKEPYRLSMFDIERPYLRVSFISILNHLDSLFVLTLKDDYGLPLRLKGQMVHVPESKSILFLCSPKAKNLQELCRQDVYLSDMPIHDKTREVLLLQDAGRMERQLVDKLEETTNNLKKLQAKLTEDKKNMDDLLYSILPTQVARKLRHHESIEAEKFDMVSTLHTDVVGFTEMSCNAAVRPIDIIRLLNKLYSEFDTVVTTYDVFKVETVGDAYFVASGIPDYIEDHADRIVDVALAMMEASKDVMLPTNGGHIKLRMGINSGPCIAGVVGKRMPRYCLFGNTITMTSKIESCSLPGKITISSTTRRCLVNPEKYRFEENNSKENMPFKCFFITAKSLISPSPTGLGLSPLPALFCSPCVSPAASRRTSTDFTTELPQPLPESLKVSTARNVLPEIDRRATIGAKIQYYSHVEAVLRKKLGNRGSKSRNEISGTKMDTKNSTLPLPNVRLPHRSASIERERVHNGVSNETTCPIRRVQTACSSIDTQKFGLGCAEVFGRRPTFRDDKTINRPWNLPVEIRITPPLDDHRADVEDSIDLESDCDTEVEECYAQQSQLKDFSIFCLPRIQETLTRKLQAVCHEANRREDVFGDDED